jgi:hypothetical protein
LECLPPNLLQFLPLQQLKDSGARVKVDGLLTMQRLRASRKWLRPDSRVLYVQRQLSEKQLKLDSETLDVEVLQISRKRRRLNCRCCLLLVKMQASGTLTKRDRRLFNIQRFQASRTGLSLNIHVLDTQSQTRRKRLKFKSRLLDFKRQANRK